MRAVADDEIIHGQQEGFSILGDSGIDMGKFYLLCWHISLLHLRLQTPSQAAEP